MGKVDIVVEEHFPQSISFFNSMPDVDTVGQAPIHGLPSGRTNCFGGVTFGFAPVVINTTFAIWFSIGCTRQPSCGHLKIGTTSIMYSTRFSWRALFEKSQHSMRFSWRTSLLQQHRTGCWLRAK